MTNGWKHTTLGDVAFVSLSGVDKHIMPGETSVSLCNYLDVYRNRRLTKGMPFARGSATLGEIARFQVQQGDVIITKDSEEAEDIGVPAVVMDDLPGTICGYHLALIRPTPAIQPLFLAYHLQSDAAKRHFLRTANGVTRFGLGVRAITTLPLLLPPPSEQTNISRVLDALDTTLNRTRTAIASARELRATLLDDSLTHGIGQDGKIRAPLYSPSEFVQTPLGRIPKAWRPSNVGAEFDLQNGFTLNAERRARLKKRPYLRVANVQRDALDLSDVQELEAGDAEFAPRVLKENDLLVVEGHADRMQIGRCALVSFDAAGMTFQNHLFRLRTKGNVKPGFGCLWLNSHHAIRYWNACCATSSGLNTINQRMLKRFAIYVPPHSEQERITALVSQQRTHLDALIAKEHCLDQLRASLLHDLLTGRVRIKI